MKRVILLLLIVHSFACTNSSNVNLQSWLSNEISNESLDNKQLILFISKGMCAECINMELKNLENYEINFAPVIVGVFDKKRYFTSTISSISDRCKPIFIYSKDCPVQHFPQQPFYCIFDARKNDIADIFYPNACDTDKTEDYFARMKNKINSK